MDADGLKALSEPFKAVTVKRMFAGSGVYAGGLCFAIESGGKLLLEVDSLSQPSFAEAGSSPFVYVARGRPMPTSFWRLPAIAREDADELRRWASLALEAARRAAEANGKPKGSAKRTAGVAKSRAKSK